MPKPGVSKQQIFNAARAITAQGALPTATKIRAMLNTGSMVTIQKHLQAWKQYCFKNSNLNENVISIDHHNYDNSLVEKLRITEQALNKQITQNEYYASELINAEKISINLTAENQQLQITNQQLQLELQAITTAKNTLAQLHRELATKLEGNENKIIARQQQIIEQLQVEIKDLTVKSMDALQQTSNVGHEALMQEKVIRINLQTKIDSLTKELAESNKQLELSELKTKIQVQTLERQIKAQQQMLQQYVSPEECKRLAQGLELNLWLAGSYGK